ncbi:MAG: hypothetical protein WB778_10325 [Thermoplasmata archaeon]
MFATTLVKVILTVSALALAGSAVGASYKWTEVQVPSSFVTGFDTNIVWNPAGYEMVIAEDAHGHSQTYGFESGHWVNLGLATPTVAPSVGDLVYDHHDGQMLLFIDFTGTGAGVQVWELSHGAWGHLLLKGGPTSSVDYPATVVYDASDGYVLYYGGSTTGCDCGSNQTWSFVSGTWHHFAGSGFPPAVEFPQVVYDGALGKVLLFLNGGGPSESDYGFWTFHAGSWIHTNPSARPHLSGAMGFDVALNAVLVSGVTSQGAGPYVFLWKSGAGGFTNISSSTTHKNTQCTGVSLEYLNYDPSEGGLLCVGTDEALWAFT